MILSVGLITNYILLHEDGHEFLLVRGRMLWFKSELFSIGSWGGFFFWLVFCFVLFLCGCLGVNWRALYVLGTLSELHSQHLDYLSNTQPPTCNSFFIFLCWTDMAKAINLISNTLTRRHHKISTSRHHSMCAKHIWHLTISCLLYGDVNMPHSSKASLCSHDTYQDHNTSSLCLFYLCVKK